MESPLRRYIQFMSLLRQFFGGDSEFDDRRWSWVYCIPPVVVAAVCFGLGSAPNGNPKAQAFVLLVLALVSTMCCWRWAVKLVKSGVSAADYVKGTTTSRMMVWFWAVFGGLALLTPVVGFGVEVWIPLWESPLYTFAGIGSLLLTAGPAYKEYKEIIRVRRPQSAVSPDDVEPVSRSVHTKSSFTKALPSFLTTLVFAAALSSWLSGRAARRTRI